MKYVEHLLVELGIYDRVEDFAFLLLVILLSLFFALPLKWYDEKIQSRLRSI